LIIGPNVRRGALVSTRYTTLNVLRTIETILGLKPLGLNDALATPMADVFDPANAHWSYRAEAADVLRATGLPIPSDRFRRTGATSAKCAVRSAKYWALAMQGQDFSSEDKLNTAAFNTALWRGLGIGPEPYRRDGRDFGQTRTGQLQKVDPAPCAAEL
jgi:hypothetical protein